MCSIAGNGRETRGEFVCAQAGCRECQDALVREHSGLIPALLRRVGHAGVAYGELVQEGRLALWRAVLGFNPERGVCFATYGGLAIERALWGAVRRARRDTTVTLLTVTVPEAWAMHSQRPEVQAALRAVVAQLPERLGAVVTALYGLDGQAPCTQAALGRAWGLSGERIRQLHMAALVTLRHPGVSGPLYQLCERDTRAAYLQALHSNRVWQRRRRR